MSEIYKVEDYMDKTFLTLKPEMDVYQAIDAFLEEGVTGAVVVDEANKVVGILSEQDCLHLLTRGSYFELPAGRVKDFMTKNVICARPHVDIFKIADMFLHHCFRRIIITDEKNTVLGQITRRDLLRIIKKIRAMQSEKGNKIAPIL